MHIKLNLAEGPTIYVPADWYFHRDERSGDKTCTAVGNAPGASVFLVRETPEQIAALVEKARREARIRENAARILAAYLCFAKDNSSIAMRCRAAGIEACTLEDELGTLFAAEAKAGKGEEL